jgi:hypothetical protein
MPSKKLLWLMPLLALASCANQTEKAVNTETAAAYAPVQDADESISTADTTARKIIRTADFVCSVQNVHNAVSKLELLVKGTGGFVQESHTTNENTRVDTKRYKADSLLQATSYTTTAHLVLRVPAQYIDSIIYTLPTIATYVESRTLKQDDVTLQYLSNRMKSETGRDEAIANAVRLAKKSKESLEIQQYKDNQHSDYVNRKIENLSLLRDVNYATISVALSQPGETRVVSIADPDYITRVPVWLQFRDAFRSGVVTCEELLIGLLNIWPLILLSVGGWMLFRRAKKRRLALSIK